ncbi:hypothetical protein [Nocardioides sp. J54]|uniref:hypothetical protein n=1 Tax=Nocardioides sp. J54 TaxID=935866 RepID=UPI00048CD8FF|nr:hypothetical protein [Nocardioides sp. J54]
MSRRVVALLVAVALAAGLVGWLATRPDPRPQRPSLAEDASYTAGTVPTAPEGSLQAVADLLPTALSYDHGDLDASLAAATATMTSAFAKDYTTTFEATVRPLATSKGAVSEAHVRAAGLVRSADDDQAVALAFVDQVLVSSKGQAADQPVKVSQVRVLVGVRKVDGEWRIDSVDPV